jgi:hypothetical protein
MINWFTIDYDLASKLQPLWQHAGLHKHSTSSPDIITLSNTLQEVVNMFYKVLATYVVCIVVTHVAEYLLNSVTNVVYITYVVQNYYICVGIIQVWYFLHMWLLHTRRAVKPYLFHGCPMFPTAVQIYIWDNLPLFHQLYCICRVWSLQMISTLWSCILERQQLWWIIFLDNAYRHGYIYYNILLSTKR